MNKTNGKMAAVLGLLFLLTIAGVCKEQVWGVKGSTVAETITYQKKDETAQIGTAKNPFTILEVVPNQTMAAVGYLFSGCEPVDISSNTAAMLKYQEVFGDYDTATRTYGTQGIAEVEMKVYGVFAADFPNDLGYGASVDNQVSNEAADKLHFGQYGYFEHVADGQGSYRYVPAQGNLSGYFTPFAENEVPKAGEATYRWVPLISYEQTQDNVAPKQSLGAYYLTGNTYTNQGLDEKDDSKSYFAFEEGSSASPFYGQTLISDVESYYPENNSALTLERDEIGTAQDVEEKRFYQFRYEQVYHTYAEYGIAHKNQWIKALFGEQQDVVTQVVTVTPEQLQGENIKKGDSILWDADMVIFHDSQVAIPVNISGLTHQNTSFDKTFSGHDLTGDAYHALIRRQASGSPAMVFMDGSAMRIADSNMGKLYGVLNSVGAKYYYNVYCNSEETGENNQPLWVAEKDANAAENQWIYDMPDKAGFFAGSQSFVLNWDGTDDIFTKVIKEDETLCENTETVLAAMGRMYPSAHSFGVGVSSSDTISYKTKVDILELQPVAEFIYGASDWRSYYLGLLPKDFVGNSENLEEDVNVTTMATYEFNGKEEDLNTCYDMILIGASQNEENGLVENGQGGYNDKKLNNYDENGNLISALAYATVGDLVSTDNGEVYYSDYSRFKNICDFDRPERYKEDNFHWISGTIDAWNNSTSQSASFIGANNGSDISQCNIRYNATDVTQKKYKELLDFSVKNPIVVDGLLFDDQKEVDKNVVDSSSFIYALAKVATSTENNTETYVVRYEDIRSSKATEYNQLVLEPACDLLFSSEPNQNFAAQGEGGKPVEYSYQVADTSDKTIDKSTIRNNDQTDENNNHVLRYHFTVQGKPEAKYKVSLAIDSDGNGDFSSEETTEDLYILDTTEGVLENTTVNQSRSEYLMAGHSYMVVRKLPETERGMLPWELRVEQTDSSSIRYVENGYTRVPGAEPETIRVLQMNLTSEDDMGTNVDTKINFADTQSDVGKRFQKYLGNVDDYDIQVTFMENYSKKSDVLSFNKYSEDAETWTAYLMQYDMLILGFMDEASFTDNEVFLAGFEAFVKAGKSVILSHDMVSDKSFAYPSAEFYLDGLNWKYKDTQDTCWAVNQETSAYLRQLSGQMKKTYAMLPNGATSFGSYARTYSRGKNVSLLPDKNLKVAYLYRWDSSGLFQGNWKFTEDKSTCAWMTRKDYLYQVPGVGENICSLMDNSIRTMVFASRVKAEDTTDRKIVNPSANNAVVEKSSLKWIDSCNTNTVKMANRGQITQYPFAIEDTISVATTHAQNYKLNLEENESSAFDMRFGVDGAFDEWADVPKTEVAWNEYATEKNYGALVYNNGNSYGYAQVNESNSASRNGGAFTSMNVQIETNDGQKLEHIITFLTADAKGNINLSPQLENLEPGSYTYYLGSTGFTSTNLEQLNENPYWHDDCIYGTARMSITDGTDEMEYSLDMSAMAQWMGIDASDIKNVTVCLYGMSSTQDNPPRFGSADTKEYVSQLETTIGGDTIVWFNLSNDGDDSTNIYSAKDGDSANNYYIYTKDNITYTGFGHAATMTDDEIRLFINTMISSFRSSPSAPYVTVENEDVINNGSISTLYAEEKENVSVKEVLLKVNDDSNTAGKKIYRMKVTSDGAKADSLRLTDGSTIQENEDGTFTVEKGKVYVLSVPYGDETTENTIAGEGKLTYQVSLSATYQNQTLSSDRRTIRVMSMPLFGLD